MTEASSTPKALCDGPHPLRSPPISRARYARRSRRVARRQAHPARRRVNTPRQGTAWPRRGKEEQARQPARQQRSIRHARARAMRSERLRRARTRARQRARRPAATRQRKCSAAPLSWRDWPSGASVKVLVVVRRCQPPGAAAPSRPTRSRRPTTRTPSGPACQRPRWTWRDARRLAPRGRPRAIDFTPTVVGLTTSTSCYGSRPPTRGSYCL